MSSTYKVEVGNYELTTTVVKTIMQLDQSLGDLLSITGATMRSQIRPLIALDIGKHYNQDDKENQVTEKVAVVKLCFDKICLIIQLLHMNGPHCSLTEFFQLQELSFAGVGINSCLDALSRDYGLRCKNAVDLGLLAATVKNEKYKSFGLLDLAYELKSAK